jgi:hypothetical protein
MHERDDDERAALSLSVSRAEALQSADTYPPKQWRLSQRKYYAPDIVTLSDRSRDLRGHTR